MRNFIQPGDSIEYSNSGSAIASGDLVAVGNRVGVAVTDIAAMTGSGTVNLEGVYEVPKDTDESFAVGDELFYDSGDSTVTKTAAGNKYAGYAFAIAQTSDTTCHLKLQPMAKQSAIVAFSAGSNLVGVDGAGSNAAPLAGTETRLDALETAVLALIAAMKASGQMSNS